MQAGHPGRQPLAERARWTPGTGTAWRFGRLRKASYWHVPLIVSWLAQALGATWPAPAHGLLSRCGAGRHADPRGPKHPVAHKGRHRKQPPWLFGLRFVLLMAAWAGSRLPVRLRRMVPKRHGGYRREKALLRARVTACGPPPGATLLLVGGEAA
jgi:hypothetical protein